jgi:hypothetical protein
MKGQRILETQQYLGQLSTRHDPFSTVDGCSARFRGTVRHQLKIRSHLTEFFVPVVDERFGTELN